MTDLADVLKLTKDVEVHIPQLNLLQIIYLLHLAGPVRLQLVRERNMRTKGEKDLGYGGYCAGLLSVAGSGIR